MKRRQSSVLLAGAICAWAATGLNASELTVNNGVATNGYVPFHFYYLDNADCRSQVIYPAEQLEGMAGNAIREVQFYLDEGGYEGNWAATEMILSLGTVEETAFDTNYGGYADFVDASKLTAVYAGEMAGEAGGKLLTFKLSSPYAYAGGNLLLQISLGSAGNAYPRANFLGVTTDTYQAAYTTSGWTTYGDKFLPKTTFTYGELAQFEASVSATELKFPVTMMGQSSTASVEVKNTGVQELTASVSGVSGAFSTEVSGGAIASGASMEIPVKFTPTAGGVVTGEMTIDLGEAGSFTVTLNGNGMEAPTGFTTTFNVPSKTLPEGWTGWLVTEEWDIDLYDYAFSGAKADTENFTAVTKANVEASAVQSENPWRAYPERHSLYMISPAVSGNVMMQLAESKNDENYASAQTTVYAATEGADGSWTIGTTPLDFNWASEPGSGWGLMIGSVSEPTHLAIMMSGMAIATFAADASEAGGIEYAATVTPETIDFGQIVVGKSDRKEITVTNTGKKAFGLTLEGMEEGAFVVEASAESVEPQQSATVTVTFAPVESGTYSLPLTVKMGEAGEALVTITGKAVGAVVGSEFTVDNVTYVVTSQTEAGVNGVGSEVTECVIPATVTNEDGIELKVTSVEREAFYWSNVAKVSLPEGLTTIGYGAFRTSPLAEINLPQTVTSIGDFAFRSTELKSVVIPDGVTAIGSSVFAQCEQLTDVKLPANLTSIGSGAFYKAAIKKIEIPASCTTIADEAFEMCAQLTEVKLPEGLTEIASMLFLGCSQLTAIEIPQSVTEIKTRAFEDAGLTTLNLPKGVAKIASSTFNNTPIETITVDAESTSFKVVDGALYDADGGFIYLFPRTGGAEDVTVADGCRGIIGGAFYGCPVKSVTLPESMIGIDEYAFCLSGLESINLPEGIFLIGTQAFAGTKLTEVVLPGALEEIGDGLFAQCTELKSVTIPASVTLIGNRAFYACQALTEIIAQGETPAEFDAWDGLTDPFLNVDCSKITVYCPDGAEALAAYKTSEWADFFENIKNISDRPESGIEAVTGDENEKAEVYNLQGRMVATGVEGLEPGIYIVKTAKGTKKIAVK